jgi:membrane protein YqaA with SNARE-associated domain
MIIPDTILMITAGTILFLLGAMLGALVGYILGRADEG